MGKEPTLSAEELEQLLKVDTDPVQAHTIHQRNTAVLEWMADNLPEELMQDKGLSKFITFRIGCPHCSHFHCAGCDYEMALPAAVRDECLKRSQGGTGNYAFYCCRFKFGGVDYCTLKDEQNALCSTFNLELFHNRIELRVYVPITENPEKQQLYIDEYKDMREKVARFLQGHVEWAEAVMQRCREEESE